MNMQKVKSSTIEAVGHDAEKNRMVVRFNNGTEYEYSNVNKEQHSAFVGADSVGSHFHAHIRGKFDHRKMEKEG